jgi:hypothetical protein
LLNIAVMECCVMQLNEDSRVVSKLYMYECGNSKTRAFQNG